MTIDGGVVRVTGSLESVFGDKRILCRTQPDGLNTNGSIFFRRYIHDTWGAMRNETLFAGRMFDAHKPASFEPLGTKVLPDNFWSTDGGGVRSTNRGDLGPGASIVVRRNSDFGDSA